MPRVPTSPGPSVAELPLPGVYQHSNATPDILASTGMLEQGVGNAIMGAASEAQRIHNDLVDQGNALRTDEATNKAQEWAVRYQHDPKDGFTTQTGYAAVQRDSGMPLADEYKQKLQEKVNEISAGLSNDRQRQMFAMKVNNIVTTFYGQALTHETKEFQSYNLSTREATASNAQNALSLNPLDPDNVDRQTTRIRASFMGGVDEASGKFIPGSAEMQGKSAAWGKEQADAAVSLAHERAVKGMLELGNVNAAVAYVNRYGKDMTAKDLLGVQGTLQREYQTRQGQTAAQQEFEAVRPALAPTGYDRLTQLVMGAESGGRDYAPDGSILTSPKGAKGRMQVLDSTNRDPGYGVRPAQNDSVEERARVGRDYLAAMVREFKGDVPKALAAYNAGPGAVEKAVADAEKDRQTGAFRGGPDPNYWLQKLPAETQKYVADITAKFQAGDGAPQKPTIADFHEGAIRRLGANPSPMAVKTAREAATQIFTDYEKATKQRAEEAVTLAMQQLEKNGGRYGDLPASTRDAVSRLAADKVDNVLNYAARIAKGEDNTNPAVYQALSDQNRLSQLSDAQFFAMKGELSLEDFKHFSNERNKLKNPAASSGPGDLNSSAIKTALDQTLREMKIDPTPKDDGGNDAARVGAIRKFVDTQVLAAQRNAGKKFTDAETVAFINKLNTSTEMKGWFSTYNTPLFGAKPGDIPSEIKAGLKAALKKQGVDDPTDAQILESYLQYRTMQPKKVSSNAR